MRADRLLSELMLLQSRGRVTAPALASELEVSVRTIYRDMEALGAAGVPVYAERGRDGGFAVLERYRSDLTGLTVEEVKALFSLAVPAALDQLGMSREVRGALLKLAAALPERLRQAESEVRARVFVDPKPWPGAAKPVPNVQLVHRAVWDERQLRVEFAWQPHIRVERTVDPLGLVAKEGEWFLVWREKGKLGVYRIGRLAAIETLETGFERPDDFDLIAFWRDWQRRAGPTGGSYEVLVAITDELEPYAQQALGVAFEPIEGLIGVARFASLEAARSAILPLGAAVEVLQPEPLRRSVADFAAQTLGVYQ
jgi:predicted DNA-binding transcriptional regulator YafY